MSENAAVVEREAFVGTGREIRTAGLPDETWYLLEFVQAEPRRTKGISQKTGQPYDFHFINYRIRGLEKATYTPEVTETGAVTGKGILEGTEKLPVPFTVFHDFMVSGKALAALTNAYKAVTGVLPNGENVDKLEMAKEMQGRKAWGRIYHSEDDTGRIKEKLAYQFRSVDQGPPNSAPIRKQD